MSRIVAAVSGGAAPDNPDLLDSMLLAARGGDDWESVADNEGSAALGWTGWRQANAAVEGEVAAVVDGTFYNRDELSFQGNEAQTLIQLYRQYGFLESLRRINGDFAVALRDDRDGSLWIARDRIGIKPLYYVASSGLFACASRPKSLLSVPGVSREINRQYAALVAASHYRYFDNDSSASPYVDIRQLPAATALCCKNGVATEIGYWTLEEMPDFDLSEEELAVRYRDLLIESVSLRLQAAGRPAFTLSGGMDSSSVLASAVKISGKKQHAFSTVYQDKTYDESDEIKTILQQTVHQWHPVALGTPDVMDCVRRMIEVHDEPVATATWLSHYLLCQEANRQGFDGWFGGLGGDELNAGEYEHFLYHFADLKLAGRQQQLDREIEHWIQYHDHPIFRKSRALVERDFSRLVDFTEAGRCFPDPGRMLRYQSALNPDYYDLANFRPQMDHPFTSYLKNRTSQDIFRETAPCCLRAEDRQATAMKLDNYLPFFDYRLVEFMYRVPGDLKIRDGVTKRLLRTAMQGVLPDSTRTRIAKTGWNAPAHVWFSGSSRQSLVDLVRSQAFRERGIYNLPQVDRLLDEHEEIVSSGRAAENHMMFFWQLVNLELWQQSLRSASVPRPKFVAALARNKPFPSTTVTGGPGHVG